MSCLYSKNIKINRSEILKLLIMRTFKLLAFVIIILSIFSCKDEVFDPTSVDIALEISKDWSVEANGGEEPEYYTATINKVPNSDNKVSIVGFHNESTVTAVIYDDLTITVDNHELSGLTVDVKDCSGIISENFQRISWSYTILDGGDEYKYTAEFTPGTITKKQQ